MSIEPNTGQAEVVEPTSPRLHTPAEAARLLTVRESWLRRQAGQRRIVATYLGRHLRFSDEDLHAIIAAHARPARTPGPRSCRPRAPRR